MSTANPGSNTHGERAMNTPSTYLPNAGLDMNGGGTYTSSRTEPSLQDYENVFGPAARNIKEDLQRFKRHGRWHLPDALKGPNTWLTDRIDGLITDATNSPFTGTILPYRYYDNVDGKLQWNVWSFDEGMASRVPYESAARTLTQTKRSFKAYAVRHGLAITMEHNFMMTPKGRENFQNQLQQLVGSIQYTNDLDVHIALLQAASYEKQQMEKYNNYNMSSSQAIREYVDLFGFMQKNTNALDILIVEAERKLKLWGGPKPNFMLTNSKLTFQLTMTPERTNYISQGPEGIKRLRQGPDLSSYRGISIIPTRAFSMDIGQVPRDVLRRRVRVAEYYRIKPDVDNSKRTFELYNEARDSFFLIEYKDLFKYAQVSGDHGNNKTHKKLFKRIQKNLKRFGMHRNDNAGDDDNDSDDDGNDGKDKNNKMDKASLWKKLATECYRIYTSHKNEAKADSDVIRSNSFKTLQTITLTKSDIEQEIKQDKDWVTTMGHIIDVLKQFEYRVNAKNRGNYEKTLKELESYRAYVVAQLRENTPVENPHYGAWHDLLENIEDEMHTENAGTQDIALTPEMVLASFFTKDLVFVPFVQRLAFEEGALSKQDRHSLITSATVLDKERRLLNSHVAASVKELHSSIVGYPRAPASLGHPSALHSPYTGERYSKNSVEYHESRMALSRMFSRYACSTHALKAIKDENGQSLAIAAKDVANGSGDAIGVMYYQPLGAFNDPNNEMHLDGVGKSSARTLHENWVLTEEVLNLIQNKPEYIQAAAKIAASVFASQARKGGSESITRAQLSDTINEEIQTTFASQSISPVSSYCRSKGVYTWSTSNNFLSTQDYLNPHNPLYSKFHAHLAKENAPHGVLTNAYLVKLNELGNTMLATERREHPWLTPVDFSMVSISFPDVNKVAAILQHRVSEDAFEHNKNHLVDSAGAVQMIHDIMGLDHTQHKTIARDVFESHGHIAECKPSYTASWVSRDTFAPSTVLGAPDGGDDVVDVDGNNEDNEEKELNPAHWEFVIIRPNIEHYMLGIIMGLSGDQLGNTLWGQTELSVYDDSQHGVWGMSYKYHERAIVFNEKNLIRLWDIAYDGYNGGKDDTYVQWDEEKSVEDFKSATNDVTQDYRGASMMVMAFYLGDKNTSKHRTNWPSPIVYHQKKNDPHTTMTALTGAENMMKISTKEFEVFDSDIYKEYYDVYQPLMPDFSDLHQVRKCACESAVDNESQSDVLAFQGTLKINNQNMMCTVINGSGHHGVDYIGVASVRSGKGYKVVGGISNLVRQV